MNTLLVVDSDSAERSTICEGLKAACLAGRLLAVARGREAIAALDDETGGVDCVVLSARLPDMSGLELLAVLRERSPAPAAIVIVEPGDEATMVAALEAGAHSCLPPAALSGPALQRVVGEALKLLRTERALDESERRFATLADAAPVPIWMSDRQGNAVFLNRTWLHHTGADREAALGSGWLEHLHPADRPAFLERLRDAQPATFASETEYRLLHHDGSSRWMLDRSRPRFDPDGRFIGYIGSSTDISEHKELQQEIEGELQQREARYRQLFLTLTEGVVQVDADGRVGDMNPAAARLLGPGVRVGTVPRWQAHDERGNPIPEAEHPIVKALQGTSQRSAVVWVAHRPGRGRWLLINAAPLELADGSHGALATVTDLSERRRAELALEERERKFRAIFEAQPGAILYTDARSRIVEMNSGVEDLFGFGPRELLGRRLWILFKESDTHENLFRELSDEGGRTLWKQHLHFLRKDNSVFPGELTLTALLDDEGAVIGYVWMIFDVTEQVRIERELARSQRELARGREEERRRMARELHDNVVQELVALGFGLSNLKREIAGPQEDEVVTRLDGHIRQTTEAVKLLRAVISDLRPAGLEEFGLEAALVGLTSKLSRTRKRDMPEVTLDLPVGVEKLPPTIALALFRTAQEALNNVIKHAGAERVRIEVRLLERQVTLMVEDDGCGFEVPRSFGDLSRDNHFGLAGLEERATLLDGTFSVRSRRGEGTEVAISLPLGAHRSS